MASYIKTLKEDNGDITYPQTLASAVFIGNSDVETEMGKYVTAEDIASTSALTPPVTTNMIANGAVTSEKINAGTATSDSGSLLLGSILIQWGVEDYGNLTYGNDWFGLKRPSSACAAIQFPTAFSSVPFVILCPDTLPIIHCTPNTSASVHTTTQTYSFFPICPPNGNGTYATKIKWIAIGEA